MFSPSNIKILLRLLRIKKSFGNVKWEEHKMLGWKTYTGLGIVVIGLTLNFVPISGADSFGVEVVKYGLAFAGIGVAHKLDKLIDALGKK